MDEKEILERLRSGDASAAEAFVRSHLPRVFQLSLRLCKRESEADDLSQDVFIRALRAIQNFKGEAALATWLHRITVNTWKNRVRHDKRRHAGQHASIDGGGRNRDGDETPGLDLPDPSASPEAWYESHESHRQILTALDKLGQDEKAIVVLRDIEMRSYEEISAVLETNIGTVKSRLSRARERLREICVRMRINQP